MRFIFYILILFLTINCNQKNKSFSFSELEVQNYFVNYPKKPLLNMLFSDTIDTNLLYKNNFIKNNNVFINKKDSTYIITLNNSFNNFIFYFKKKNTVKLSEEIFNKLNIESVNTTGNYFFSEFYIFDIDIPYKFTYFTTDNFIRIHFKKI